MASKPSNKPMFKTTKKISWAVRDQLMKKRHSGMNKNKKKK